MANIHTVSVNRAAQLVEGEWYAVKGTDGSGLPLPPQVYQLEEKHVLPTGLGLERILGTLRAHLGDRIWIYRNREFYPSQVNIPEHGLHDIHLERMRMEDVPFFLSMGQEQRDVWIHRQKYGFDRPVVTASRWARMASSP